jgi:hypothetical protein
MIQKVVGAVEDLVLPLDAFIRSIGVNRAIAHSLFLGAGCSTSSGIPSAENCIWEWKRSIFLTRNRGLEGQFGELSLYSVRQRIQEWIDKDGTFPKEGAPEEYSHYIQACFPIAADRRAFFQEKVRAAQPHIGYQLLAHLASTDIVNAVWTTNFDGLPAKAAGAQSLTPIEVGIDSKERIVRAVRKGEILCVSLHGDYRYDKLKNTVEELQSQDAVLRTALCDHLAGSPLIVVGYSGRDASIMESLAAAYSKPGAGTLYWCGYGDGPIREEIFQFLQQARANGRSAYYVQANGFDDLMIRLAQHCLDGAKLESIKALISKEAQRGKAPRRPFSVPNSRTANLIKSNMFALTCPAEVLQFQPRDLPTEGTWRWLREKTEGKDVIAVPMRGKVLAFGTIDALKDAFIGEIVGPIERVPVESSDLRYEEGVIVNMMRSALARSLASSAKLETDGKGEIWFNKDPQKKFEAGVQYLVFESALLKIRFIGGNTFLVVKPSLKVLASDGTIAPKEVANKLKLAILGYQHNKEFNQAMAKWRQVLLAGKDPSITVEYPPQAGTVFRFHIERSPLFSAIEPNARTQGTTIPDSILPLVRYRGIELTEPPVLFSSRDGKGIYQDTHPIRGLLQNRPFDYPLTERRISPDIKLGIVCPASSAGRLSQFLQNVNKSLAPTDKERDYLLDYPGFAAAYGLPINIPSEGGPGWITCPEPTSTDLKKATLELGGLINRAIQSLQSSYAPNVVLVFFPAKWEPINGFADESERFDIHDFVKASSVQKGVATQFLREKTIQDAYQCRVWWWLSLALYAKSMRTPWLIDSLDSDTAYVGLGFSIDRNAPKGQHVVLGCSHIYSSRGEGLQYRLARVENPIIRNGNPYVSKDDARRLGESIRQLFFESKMKLPGRVVIHRRTDFRRDEQEGLLDGLGGVREVEMIEIQQDSALRFVASVPNGDGTFKEDAYPVRRGTAVRLDDFTALAWVHGAAQAADGRRTYYKGKRRIPAPLLIKRHCGTSSLRQIAEEIMGLSKMNWNTFDLYSKMPATISSSGDIARIGSLLTRFNERPYDYRLFM